MSYGHQWQRQAPNQHPQQYWQGQSLAPQSQPQPYWQGQSYGPQAYAPQPPRDPMSVFQVAPETYARGKKLVTWSRLMLLAGFLISFGGCGATAATGWGGALGLGVLACAIIVVAAAVVGTIGRRLQGRII